MVKLQGYKTIIFNIATIVILLGGALTGTITDPTTLRVMAVAMAVANVALRFVTTSPVGGPVPIEPPKE